MRLIAFAAAALLAQAVHAEPPANHAVLDDTPRLGSLSKRDGVTHVGIDPNKSYANLSAEDKARVRSRYANLGPDDEPPFPADGLRPLLKAVHQAAKNLQPAGKLSMYVTVDENGKASGVEVVNSPDEKTTQAVAAILVLTKYKAGIMNGKPATMQFPFEMNFKLDY